MTIFEYISDILHTKRRSSASIEDEQEFSPFILNRWLSMYSPTVASKCNIINKYLGCFSKQELYNLFHAVIPRQPFKKITYFKKRKAEENDETADIDLIAKNKELSKREVLFYLEALKTISK